MRSPGSGKTPVEKLAVRALKAGSRRPVFADRVAAAATARAAAVMRPDIADTIRREVEKWWEPDYGKRFIDGLGKAGLEIASK